MGVDLGTYPMFVGGRAESPNADLTVREPYASREVARVAMGTADDVERGIAAAVAAAPAMAAMPAYARADVLRRAAAVLDGRRDELVRVLMLEAGKIRRDADGEVDRLVDTFSVAAIEATQLEGSVLAMDQVARGAGVRGMSRPVPIGPCGLITPFNFPLNLVAHKVAPAIAAGCPFVLKPADKTPVSALMIGAVLAESGLPDGAFSIIPCAIPDAAAIVSDARLPLLSFTGSDRVGRMLAAQAGMKRTVFELGGNAACVIDEHTDLDDCLPRLVAGGFAYSGQSCISVQRILVHRSLEPAVLDGLVARVSALVAGDPADAATDVGPMIDENAATRLESWIAEAEAAGATVHTGGTRRGALMPAHVLSGVPADAALSREEAFGPVVIVDPFDDFDDALDRVNASRFGLQAGVFTRDVDRMHRAWDRLEVGAVVINEIPSFRLDPMPYGGVKASGLGREGLRSAIADMTEDRLLVVRDLPRPR